MFPLFSLFFYFWSNIALFSGPMTEKEVYADPKMSVIPIVTFKIVMHNQYVNTRTPFLTHPHTNAYTHIHTRPWANQSIHLL